jgi:hypothetical protein
VNVARSRRPRALLLLACVLTVGAALATAPAASAATVPSFPSVASAASVPSVASATPSAAPLPQKAWTIMVYMDGDNDLEKYVTLDIERELCRPGSNADVNVVCIADRTPGYDRSRGDWKDTKLFYCTQGMTATPANAVADWGERNMGDPQTVIDFVTWAKTNYPAANYALVFWDHGYMWFRDWTIWDRTAKDALDQDELAAALQVCGPVDVIGWDCCNMQLAEVAATVRPYAQVMVGSEEYTNWEGLQYDKVVANLERYPWWTPEQLGSNMAATARGDSVTFSAIALDARFDTLIAAVDHWALALKNGLRANRRAYDAARAASQRFYDTNGERDLFDAARQIRAHVKSPSIRASCTAVMDAVLADVTYNWFRLGRIDGVTYGRCQGLAIWWPKTRRQLDPSWNPGNDWVYYRTKLAFAAQTHWDEFLAAYVR